MLCPCQPLAHKLLRNQDTKKEKIAKEKKKTASNKKNIAKDFLKKTVIAITQKSKKAGSFLKKAVVAVTRFLCRSRKTVLLVVAVVLLTLIFSFLIALWLSSFNFPNGDYDRTVPTTGTIKVQGLEIYGGDILWESEKVLIDWGELTLGDSKNASFYVKSTSNVDVELGLNVTNWAPAGIEEYITISWDYNGTLLKPTQELLATVNLEISQSGDLIDFLVENSVSEFGFDIIIYASGV